MMQSEYALLLGKQELTAEEALQFQQMKENEYLKILRKNQNKSY